MNTSAGTPSAIATRNVGPLLWAILVVSALFAIVGVLQTIVVWTAFFLGALPTFIGSGVVIQLVFDYFPWVVTILTFFWCSVCWTTIKAKRGAAWARKLLGMLLAAASAVSLGLALWPVTDPAMAATIGNSVIEYVVLGLGLSVLLGFVAFYVQK